MINYFNMESITLPLDTQPSFFITPPLQPFSITPILKNIMCGSHGASKILTIPVFEIEI